MINKDEMIANIKKLLKGYADSSNDVKITTRTPKEADVYIDGKLFNTYLIEEKQFKYNILMPDGDFKITVEVSRTDLAETHPQYKAAELQLPAAENEIRDALLRARITNTSQGYAVTKCIMYETDLAEELSGEKLELVKLNYLAKVMSRFTIYEHKQFRGYMEKKGMDHIDVNILINIAYNLGSCEIIDTIFDDISLGKMYADNGMLSWLENADRKVWEYLDYEKIGKDIRTAEDGIFAKDGYFTCNQSEYVKVYDGKSYPERFEEDVYIFKLLIDTKQVRTEDTERWLKLPASKEAKAKFLKDINADSFDECVLLAFQSLEPKIPMHVSDLSQLGLLNSLAHRMRDMEKNGELAKFKGLLEWSEITSLEDVIVLANSLQDYEIYPESSSVIEYAKDKFKATYQNVIPKEIAEHFNFGTYSAELMKKESVILTEYGIIRNKNADEKRAVSEDKTDI